MRILIVDDEPACLKLAHVVLAADGHEVSDAAAVENALEEIDRCEPEVILLDLEMPHVNGLALARKLKGDLARKHIMIIAVTAFPGQFPRETAMEAGCDAYLIKPINTRKLTSQVTNIVQGMK